MDSSLPSPTGARRRHSASFKRELVEQTLTPGASVAAIALEHQLNANLLHKWRRQFLMTGLTRQAPAADLLAVEVDSAPQRQPAVPTVVDGQIEIACGRLRVRITGRVDAQTLRTVLGALEAA